jgi:hypothetical protein
VDRRLLAEEDASGPVTVEEFPGGRMFFPEERASARNVKNPRPPGCAF